MIAERIKTLRTARGYTQRQLAELVKVSQQTIDHYENSRAKPPADTIIAFAELFACSTDYLLGRVDSPTDSLIPERAATPEDFEGETLTPEERAKMEIRLAVAADAELAAFWDELEQRPDLQLLFRQTKSMTPETIRKVMRIIKAIEDEEAAED